MIFYLNFDPVILVSGDDEESCNSSLYLTADDSEEDFLDAVEEQSNKKSGMITTAQSNLLPDKYKLTSITFSKVVLHFGRWNKTKICFF